MTEPTKKVTKQMGKMHAIVDGQPKEVPVELTIEETFHADGRKDTKIKVPRLATQAKEPKGPKGD